MSNENKQLTLLEKFEQGWEIMNRCDNTIAVQVVKQKLKDSYAIEWSDGEFVQGYLESDKWLICTPPKERKTLYIHDGLQGIFASTEKFPYEVITEIHLEKNGDKWEVVTQ
jgi:hypothetical protein